MERYDFVIIGSGLGGLECGEILSKEGYSVCILEKNNQIGGNLQIFSRDKALFDTGIHYIGGLEKGQNLYQYFKYLGIADDLKLKRLDMDGFDIISFDDDPKEYRYAQGYDRFVDELLKSFPNEQEGLVKYCEKIREVCDSFPMYNLKSFGNENFNFKYLETSAKEFIESCTTDKKLQSVLAGSNALYAGEGDKTPLYVHALVTNTYIESSWRCVDGASQIATLLRRKIINNGGVILRNTEAIKFQFEGDRIDSVQVDRGEQIRAVNFISNIHPAVTMSMIEEGKVRKSYKKRIQGLENSTSVFVLYIVLKEESLPYFNHNYYHFKHPEVWNGTRYTEADWPTNYALFTSAHSRNTGYSHGLIMMTYMRFEEVAKWSETFNTYNKKSMRGDEYEDFKRRKADIMFDELEKKIPEIRKITKSYYTSTPLTLRDYIGTVDGSMYGYSKDFNNPMKSFLAAKTKVPNLYLTGQNLNLHGVLGVTIGAFITCSEFIDNRKLMKRVIEA